MPVFKSGEGNAPDWCEMENFELIELDQDEIKPIERTGKMEQLIVCRGTVVAKTGQIECTLPERGKLDLNGPTPEKLTIRAVRKGALVFRAIGRWKSITGSGIFEVWNAPPPTCDTPHDYEKTTRFDNHYHDCDEYWIFFEGECRVASEGKFYDVRPGDCLVTGMGWHHDVVSIEGDQRVKAVYFEGTLEGKKRNDHLWEPKHGTAEPQKDRI